MSGSKELANITPPVLSTLALKWLEWEDYVEIFVDGVLLAERLVAAQKRAGAEHAFNETGIGWGYVDHHYEGQPAPLAVFNVEVCDAATLAPTRGLLTTCNDCNIQGCFDSDAEVAVEGGIVTLSRFALPVSTPPLEMEPIRFVQAQFADEVRRTHEWWRRTIGARLGR